MITRVEKRQLRENAKIINEVASSNLDTNIKKDMYDNLKGALIGGGVGVLIAIASRKNVFLYGIVGLIAGRILFKIKE